MSAATASNTEHQVYVRLLDEGTMVYRATTGILVGADTYLLKAPLGYDKEDENWEFPPGSFVKCVERVLSDGCVLVASELAE